jgi:hypothetical protein
MKKRYEAHASVSEWTDEAGKKCKRTVQVGTVFESANGRLVMKLDCVPTSRDWSGWVAFRPCAAPLPEGRKASPGMPPAPAKQPEDDSDEDMPF